MKLETYGLEVPGGVEQATIELRAFSVGAPNGLGRYGHMRNAIDLIWNSYQPGTFIWNDWTEWMIREFCEEKWVTVTGPAASWKTTSASIYVLGAWYASPNDTVVVCTSTTLDGLRRRIWKEVSRFWRLRPAIGNAVQSRNCIQWQKGLDEAGIFGLATDKGEIEKAVGKIIGFHAPNVIIVVDEMPYTPEAIVEAAVNLESGCKHFQFIGLGNADDMLDPHGRMSEPRGGWESISEESERWETKRGVCIHLDGLKSPNVRAGKNVYPGLLTQQDIDTTAAVYGIDSPQFWQMRRGYWAPEGIQKTVLSMPMIVKGKAQSQAVFDTDFALCAALDPAFEGGDRCVLRFGKCGFEEGRKVLCLGDIIFVKTKASAIDPIHYQILRQVRDECMKRGVEPQLFALDSTGEGGGLTSIFQREWSPEILGVEFGGRPSRHPISQTNPKRADQEYDRAVTELWFFFRLLVQGEQIKGLDHETASEFCRRWYDMKGPYISIETKAQMKERTRKSPDLADTVVIMARLCFMRLGLRLERVMYSEEFSSMWNRWQKERSLESFYEAGSY